jgi:hypothetical protein
MTCGGAARKVSQVQTRLSPRVCVYVYVYVCNHRVVINVMITVDNKFLVKLKSSSHSSLALSITAVTATDDYPALPSDSMHMAMAYPHSDQLHWLYGLVLQQVRNSDSDGIKHSSRSSPKSWPTDSPLGVAAAALKALGMGFQCCKCGSTTSMRYVLRVVHNIESTRCQWTRARHSEEYLNAQAKQFELCMTNISRNSYCVYDIGSRLCISLINAQR